MVKWYLKQLKKIVGGKIVGSFCDEREEFFGLKIKNGGKTYHLWILRDDEGNGPGSFEIEEVE